MRSLLGSCFLLALVAAPVAAQEASPNALGVGTRALSFALPEGGGGELGLWRMRRADRRVGLFLHLDGSVGRHASTGEGPPGDETSRQLAAGVTVGPALRRYLDTEGRVLPFWQSEIGLGYRYARGTGERESDRFSHSDHALLGRAATGVGIEWFPLPQASISGYTGVRLDAAYSRSRGESRGAVPGERAGESESAGAKVQTFTSGIYLTLFLPRRP